MSVGEIARERKISPEQAVVDLIEEDDSRIQAVYFTMSGDNIKKKIAIPWVSFCSDAGSYTNEGVFPNNTGVRQENKFIEYFTVSSLILLALIALLINRFPKESKEYSAIANSLNFQNREESLITTRPLNRNNLPFLALDSLLIGFFISVLKVLAPQHLEMSFLGGMPSSYYLELVEISFIVFLLLIGKYLLITAFTRLYRLGEFRFIQFYNSLRYSIWVFLPSFVILVIIYLFYRQPFLQIYSFIINMVVFLLIVRLIILFFKLMNYSDYKNFHLFSYLCATEIIPFLVLYNITLG
jgi:hypothetical protein